MLQGELEKGSLLILEGVERLHAFLCVCFVWVSLFLLKPSKRFCRLLLLCQKINSLLSSCFNLSACPKRLQGASSVNCSAFFKTQEWSENETAEINVCILHCASAEEQEQTSRSLSEFDVSVHFIHSA